ncbi:MAG: S8 family serine peptidase [bacterium]
MEHYFKTVAIIFIIIIANYCAAFAQPKIPANPSHEKLQEKQSIGYQIKHGLLKRNTTPQSTNIDNGTHTPTEIKENDNYYNDRVYIKFKTHSLNITTVNPNNSKLYTRSFSDANMDEIATKYNFDKIEQAFKINQKKYKEYLEKPNVNENGKRNLNNIFVVYFSKPVDILKFITEFSKFDNIEYIEPVPKDKYFATPNDTYYSSQFYFEHIQAESAWAIHKGEDGDSTIIIGICDSGVEWMHSDLMENLYQNLGEDADDDGHTIEHIDGEWVLDPGDLNDTDDDGNGYSDDLVGWNFYTNDGTNVNDPNASTSNQHGTHVAGISAGVTNNSNGIASISWNVKFLPTKHGNNGGGSSIYNGYDGIIYLAEFGADVINCSWGGYGASASLQEVIDYAVGLGSIIIAASGNSNIETPHFPSSYHGIISVASIAENDSKAYYSNYGAVIDISAYGGDNQVDNMILSSIPGNNYDYFQGTSMASPLVAGLTGLIKSYQPTYSNSKIIEILLGNAENIDTENSSYIDKLGYGKINAYKSLKNLDATISKSPKVNLLQQELISKCGLIRAGDTVKVVYKFSNSNPLYGSNNVEYHLFSTDTNVVVVSGSKEIDVNADADFTLDSLVFRINKNAQPQNANVGIIFTNEEGFDSDSIFYTYFSINELSEVRAYVAWGHDIDPLAPVKFPLDNATNLTYLTDDMSPMYVIASTWANGKWYCVEDDYDLITLDTTSGARTYIGNLGKNINGLAFDMQTNMIWGVGNADGDDNYDDLFLINPNDATAKLMASPNNGLIYINLACTSNGQLYSIDIAKDLLVGIDKWTGNAYTVFELQDDFIYAQDMDYDLKNDKIFAATYNSYGESSISYVDLVNYKLSKISDIQNNDEITGLVIPHNFSSPYAFDLVSPEFASTMENNLAFKWEKFTGATQYYVYISNYSNFTDYNVFSTTDTSIVLDAGAIPYGPVYWLVAAVDAGGNYYWSWQWMFEYKGKYCNALNYYCDEYISTFELGDFSNSSDCGLILGYSDYTDRIIDVFKDSEYSIKITNPKPYQSDNSAVWIDFNANDNFDQEEIISLTSYDGGSTFEGSVYIPAEADTGLYRLRARLVYLNSPEPCGYEAYGETEDYTIHIKRFFQLPTLTTNDVTGITSTSAISGGIITDPGDGLSSKGLCWNSTGNPTIADYNKTIVTSSTSNFTIKLSELSSNTKYYVRSFASNSDSTVYGNEVSFTTATTAISKQQNILFELQTGAWCSWCPDGFCRMDSILLLYPQRVFGALWHNYDSLTITADDTISSKFGINAYPSALFNRLPDFEFYNYDYRATRVLWRTNVENLLAEEPIISVTNSWSINGQTLTVKVNTEILTNYSKQLTFNVIITEDSLSGTGSGWDQQNANNTTVGHPYYNMGDPITNFKHNMAVRQNLGGVFGVKGSFPSSGVTKGSTYDYTFTYEIPENYKKNNLNVICFVQVFDTLTNDYAVLNASESEGSESVPSSWEYVETGNNATIIVDKNGENMFCDRQIATGDAIGFFYMDGKTEKCAGYSYWKDGENLGLVAWGDDEMTEEKDGFAVDETYVIKMWDASLGKEVKAKGTIESGKNYYTINGITEYSSIDAICTETHSLALAKGWNMVSTYIQPTNDSIKVVLKPIVNNLVIAKNGAGLMYYPSKSIDLIKKWNVRQGYMVYMKDKDTVDITGMPLPKDSLLYLAKGWNLIAYTRKTEQAITTALAGIVSNMVIAKNGAGLMYYPSKNINLIGNLKPGAGYMIYMKTADTLDYPEGSGKRTVDEFVKLPTHLITKTSPYNMNIIIETDLPDEYEIGAYDTDGELVGSGLVENGKAAVTIFADDENTYEIDGASADEPVTFKAYNPKNDFYENFGCTEIQDLVSEKMLTAINYSTNTVLTAKAATELKTGEDYNISIYPNPTKNKIELQINFSTTTDSDIKVYDLQGNELISVFAGNLPQGESKLQINCESLPNGTYNVIIQMKDKSITKRFVVAR